MTDRIRITQDGSLLRVEWDNRRISKEWSAFWFLLVFWFVWTPVVLCATASLVLNFRLSFAMIWCLFGWVVMLVISYMFAGLLWREWVEVSQTEVTLGSHGFLAPQPRTFAIDSIQEIALGWYSDGNRHESMTTLQVVRRGWTLRPRQLFGYWLAPALKEHVFETIGAFVEAKNIPITLTVYGR
jgi:hypothetical protein